MLTHFFKTTFVLYIIVGLVAASSRLFFIFMFPEIIGDGYLYSTVADNILSGCGVSISDLNSGECVPHFGGNQGPGYPTFIASVWWISGHSDLAVRLGQGVAYIAALLYLVGAVKQFTQSAFIALLVGLVLSMSPLQMAWPRFFFTETLAMAGALWLFAELIKSVHEKRLRAYAIGFTLIFATFIRLDAILLWVPVIVASFLIHKPTIAIKKLLIIGLMFSMGWGSWALRNINIGLPNPFMPLAAEQYRDAKGVSVWIKTWATNQYSSAGVHFPVNTMAYDKIQIDEYAFNSFTEKEVVLQLIKELQLHVGKQFPKHIDDQFGVIASNRIKNAPLNYYLYNPIKRTWNFWSNINTGFGWPGFAGKLSPQERLNIINGDMDSKISLLIKYPTIVMGKIAVNTWKIIVLFLLPVALLLNFKNKMRHNWAIIYIVLSFILARSILSGWMFHVESRYAVSQMPIIEAIVIIILSDYFLIRRKSHLN